MLRKNWKKVSMFFLLLAFAVTQMGCPQPRPPRIDLSQVNEEFSLARGADLQLWVQDFEWRVNQVYLGKDFVSVDLKRAPLTNKLQFIGFVDRNNLPGYQEGSSDMLLFKIKQTQPFFATSSMFHYNVEDHNGWVYKTSSRSRAGYGLFFAWWFMPRYTSFYYYTPRTRIVWMGSRRSIYRRSPAFSSRRTRFASYSKRTASRRRAASRSRSSSRGRSSSRSRGGKR